MKKWIVTILIMAVIIISFLFIPIKSTIVFYEKNTDDIVAYIPLKVNDTFEIIFVHSIHLTDVTEKYEITSDYEIRQYEMIFSDFGIGMPYEVKGYEEIDYVDGFYRITNMNNRFESLQIRNGKTVSEHRLVWQSEGKEEKQVFFNDFFEQGAWFTVKPVKLSMVDTWREVKIHE